MSVPQEPPPADTGASVFAAINWAIDLPHITDGRGAIDLHLRLVAFVLAKFSDGDTGRNARPSIATLVDKTALPESTVRDVLARGQKLGLWASGGVTPRGVEVWHLQLSVDLTGFDTAKKRDEARKRRNAERKAAYRRKQRLAGSGGTDPMSHGNAGDMGSNSTSDPMSHGNVRDAGNGGVPRECAGRPTGSLGTVPRDQAGLSHGIAGDVPHDPAGYQPETSQGMNQPGDDLPVGPATRSAAPSANVRAEAESNAAVLGQEDVDEPPMLNFDSSFTPLSAEEIDTQTAPKAPRKPSTRSGRNTSGDDQFEHAWQAYGRVGSKAAALKSWRTATRKTPAETILAAIPSYASATRTPSEPERHPFKPARAHMATWLNQGRWTDQELETEQQASVTPIDRSAKRRGDHARHEAAGVAAGRQEPTPEQEAATRAQLEAMRDRVVSGGRR